MALPFEKALERARAEARIAISGLAVLTERALAAAPLPGRNATKSLLALQNAVVELKKHAAMAAAYLTRFERGAAADAGETAAAVAEQRRLHQECVEWVEAANAALAQTEWVRAQARAANEIGKAGEGLARARVAAERAAALSPDALARRCEKVVADLDRHLTAAKRAVATTIADEKRFKAAAGENGPDDFWARRLHAPDTQTMARVLAAQESAVEDLKQQLRDVNDRVEGVKRRARIEAARRALLK